MEVTMDIQVEVKAADLELKPEMFTLIYLTPAFAHAREELKAGNSVMISIRVSP